MVTDELKPVPCGCGGEAKVDKHTFHGLSPAYGVTCENCGCQSWQFYSSKTEAITAWNRAMGADHFRDVTKMIERTAMIQPINSVTPKYQGFGDGEKLFAYGYICPNCKGYVREGDKYCAQCGMRLEWGNDE